MPTCTARERLWRTRSDRLAAPFVLRCFVPPVKRGRDRSVTAKGASQELACSRVAANGAAPPGAEPSSATNAVRRAPGGAVRGQAPP